jgi:hypothetical protein
MRSAKVDRRKKKFGVKMNFKKKGCTTCMSEPCECALKKSIRSMKFEEGKDYSNYFFSLK